MPATRVAKIDLVVLDNQVVPIGDIQRAIRAHLHIDRTEFTMMRDHKWRHFLCGKTPAVIFYEEAIDLLRGESAGDEITLEVIGKISAADALQAGMTIAADPGHCQRR